MDDADLVTPSLEHYRTQLARAVDRALACPWSTVDALALWLYDTWYSPATGERFGSISVDSLVAHYRAADASGATFEPGWSVVPGDEAVGRLGPPTSPWQVAVSRRAEVRWIDPVDLQFPDGVGLRPQPGDGVAVAVRRDLVDPAGWWSTATSDWHGGFPAATLRVYWDVTPSHVAHLVEVLTTALASEVTYALKCPLDLERCRRPDGTVLYVRAADWPTIAGHLARALEVAAIWLRPGVPAFTLPLVPGVGVAEDPIGDSFGASRCRMLATELHPRLADGSPQRDRHRWRDELSVVAEQGLSQRGIALAAPWRNPGSSATYRWDR